MKEYEPSPDFVARVLRAIEAAERVAAASRDPEEPIGSALWRYAVAGGGVLLGLLGAAPVY